MDVYSFRQLLIKKAGDDSNLIETIKAYSDFALEDSIIESLEKMAVKRPNDALAHWADSATDLDAEMFHDALSHHISHYKAALDANNRDLADQHLKRVYHLADMGSKANNAPMKKISFKAVSPNAWEMNYSGADQRLDQHGQKKRLNNAEGWGRRTSNNGLFSNYRFLEMSPHPGYTEFSGKGKLSGHVGQYPFEDMQVNGKYVHVDHDLKSPGAYTPHPFDSHPIFAPGHKNFPVWDMPNSAISDKHKSDLATGMHEWLDSPHLNSWIESQGAKEESDPLAFMSRGQEKSKSVLPKVAKLTSAE
jgi:hypothetical protein